MSIKLACIGYAPPPHYPGAKAFNENIWKFRSANEMFLFSDWKDYNYRPIPNPEELAGVRNNRWGLNNALFATALRFAAIDGITHFIYLESDCRVGVVGWDAIVFEEYFKLKFPAIAAGSIVTHGCVNGGQEFYRRFEKMIGDNCRARRHSIPIYGVPVSDEEKNKFPANSQIVIEPGSKVIRYKPAVYPNGALGVYDTAWLCELFGIVYGLPHANGKNPNGHFLPKHNLQEDFIQQVAWDHLLGMKLYDRFGSDVFDVTAHLDSVYSGFGNRFNTETERLQMLHDKRAVCVHQIKSEATF